jgi:hypothetical protein
MASCQGHTHGGTAASRPMHLPEMVCSGASVESRGPLNSVDFLARELRIVDAVAGRLHFAHGQMRHYREAPLLKRA